MHIAYNSGSPTDINYRDNFISLCPLQFEMLMCAAANSLKLAMCNDLTLVVTFKSHIILDKADFDSLVHHMDNHDAKKRIVSITPDCIVILTKGNFILTIRLYGATKFVESVATGVEGAKLDPSLLPKQIGLNDSIFNYKAVKNF